MSVAPTELRAIALVNSPQSCQFFTGVPPAAPENIAAISEDTHQEVPPCFTRAAPPKVKKLNSMSLSGFRYNLAAYLPT